jgi:hypothetical protein
VKVIFLDFDGVLNCKAYFEACLDRGSEPTTSDEDSEASALDPEALSRLNRIVEATDAKVVVSSSWRHGRSVEQLETLLRSRGFRGAVHDKTMDWSTTESGIFAGEQRGDEIREWLDRHPQVDAYVVLDDDNDMDAVRERFVQTDMHGGGLQDSHVERVIFMLGGSGR